MYKLRNKVGPTFFFNLLMRFHWKILSSETMPVLRISLNIAAKGNEKNRALRLFGFRHLVAEMILLSEISDTCNNCSEHSTNFVILLFNVVSVEIVF